MEKREKDIIKLFLKSWEGSLSQDEKEDWEKLLKDPAWAKLNEELLDDNFFMSCLREYNKYDVSGDFVKFWKYVQMKQRRRKIHRIWWYCLGGVAACLLLIVGIECAFQIFDHKVEQAVDRIALARTDVSQDKIRLILDDSNVVDLTDGIKSEALTAEGVIMRTNSQSLDYSNVEQSHLGDSLVYHTLIIPQGKIFRMTLADGTRVVLNAGTKMKYPVFFSGARREVSLEGEAYFEVAKDESHPFIVSGKDFSVEVLGTSFNIVAYGEECESNVTLVSGQILLNALDSVVYVSPGQQVVISQEEGVAVRHVDVKSVISWQNLRLDFREERLAMITKQLGRWYGVDVVYRKEELKDELYSGTIPYNIPLEELLELLNNTTDIKFTLNNGIVFVNESD